VFRNSERDRKRQNVSTHFLPSSLRHIYSFPFTIQANYEEGKKRPAFPSYTKPLNKYRSTFLPEIMAIFGLLYGFD
jgi:hypothetical protein